MSQARYAKLMVAIHRLREEANRLERQANEDDILFMSTTAFFGSKLTGSPGTADKHQRVKELREKANLLEQVQKGQIALSDLPSYRASLIDVNNRIAVLQEVKNEIAAQIALLEEAEKIMTAK